MLEGLDARAAAFHEANPHVYAKLCDIALAVKRSGARHFGIAALFERLRWISWFETDGDAYKLNNSYRAWYARKLMADEPELDGFFAIRDSPTDPDYRDRLLERTDQPVSIGTTDGRLF